MKPLSLLTAYLENLSEPHILFDAEYRILAANEAYRRAFGSQHSVVGRRCYEVSHHFSVPCDQAGETCPLARARQSGQREHVLHLHHTPVGQEYVNIELTPLPGEGGAPAYFVEKMETLPGAHGRPDRQGLIGRSPTFQRMLALVARVAPSRASVLLLGESGTGKEMVARAIHEASPRAGKALVPVECSSLPESLFESELFGHERGAFTGASGARAGLVEAASGGTLFLDEVGDIPLSMQVKLLRLLEAGTYRRVGSNEIRHADIRVVAATHRDLVSMVRQGRFREDLYYRLATFPVHLPPLRERRADLPLLAEALLQRIDPQRPRTLAPAALQALMAYDYPGNVRELRNVLERAVLLSDQPVLDADTVREAIDAGRIGLRREPVLAPPTAADVVAPGDTPVATAWRTREAQALREAVQRHRGTRAELARQLGMSERTLYRKLKALGLASTGGSDRP